jgi:hypothetical protein
MSGPDFRAGRGTWRVLATIDQKSTGLFGNHNPAVVRDPFGRVGRGNDVAVAFSSAKPTYIWSFRIHQARVKLNKPAPPR